MENSLWMIAVAIWQLPIIIKLQCSVTHSSCPRGKYNASICLNFEINTRRNDSNHIIAETKKNWEDVCEPINLICNNNILFVPFSGGAFSCVVASAGSSVSILPWNYKEHLGFGDLESQKGSMYLDYNALSLADSFRQISAKLCLFFLKTRRRVGRWIW